LSDSLRVHWQETLRARKDSRLGFDSNCRYRVKPYSFAFCHASFRRHPY
jgi:hypothetical protein